ncbi:protein-L-isoaspartate(D-aspartate) O-methyltransferase [Gemmatimonas aurantiaca]|uniref:protein-L-isoaspartate(D-aspartate) O-methyltransferase n=1 Tax=Gemmatimonas aurantiaca TaxID=173480 RepID=UPI00301D0857
MVAGAIEPEFRGARRRLVEALQDKGIKDLALLRAVDTIPRHLFVPSTVRHRAYEDSALPIGNGQTISQPWVHARSVEQLLLTGTERALEIGTGSGYQTALLSELAAQVFSVERYRELLDRARPILQQAGVRNVSLSLGDGTLGWREYAPYDAIVVSAGAPHVPPALEEQLAEGGRLLIPIGSKEEQMLTVFTKRGGRLERRDITPVRFVPLIGAGGWPG